jgi:hypothetical protein
MVNDDRMEVSEKNMIIMYYGANYEMALNYIRTLLRVLNVHSLQSYTIIVLSELVLQEDLSSRILFPVKLLSVKSKQCIVPTAQQTSRYVQA